MNRLRQLRQLTGMRQKDVAEKLGTTQQTVARWEKGQVGIPTDQLVALASLFSCRVDDILEMDTASKKPEVEGRFLVPRDAEPYGTMIVRFGFGERRYPVDDAEYRHMRDLSDADNPFSRRAKWIDFTTLDNRIVLLNVKHVRGVRAVARTLEDMPFYAPLDVYRHLTLNTPLHEINPSLVTYRQELLKHLSPDLSSEAALDHARDRLRTFETIDVDGEISSARMTRDTAYELRWLIQDRPVKPEVNGVPEHVLLTVQSEESDGGFEHVNLDWVAVIDVPEVAWSHCMLGEPFD